MIQQNSLNCSPLLDLKNVAPKHIRTATAGNMIFSSGFFWVKSSWKNIQTHERRESFLCDIDRQNYQESFHQIFPHEETMEKLRTKKVGTCNLLPKSSGQMRPLRAWLWFLARNSWARFTVWSWDGHRLLPVVVYIDCILYFNIQFIPYVYMYIYICQFLLLYEYAL